MQRENKNINDKYKKLTIELSDKINKISLNFIIDILKQKGEEDTKDLINFIISSHLSSLFTTINQLSSDNLLMNKKVIEFEKGYD